MDEHHLRELATAFFNAFRWHEPPPPREMPLSSLSLDEAYDVQRRVIERRTADGERPVGYKVGCTSKAIRAQFGLTEPICGRLMEPHVHDGDAELDSADFFDCAVEPELVFRIGRDLQGDSYTDDEIRDAIASVAPGIEVHNYRFWFAPATSQELIMSNGIHACLVIGVWAPMPEGIDWELESVGVFVNDGLAASGIGAEIMGGPLKSVAWLAAHLNRRGECLRAGDLVIPGSAVELIPVTAGDTVRSAFTHFGTATARFR